MLGGRAIAEIVDKDIEAYATRHTTPAEQHLLDVAEYTEGNLGGLQMLAGLLEGRFLEMLVFALGARRVLEVGTFSGYSALSMAAGLPSDGRIITCEINPVHVEVARRHIAQSQYADRIEVREGPAIETIATLQGPFDFVFIDADKTGYPAYFEATLPLLSERGLIAIDDTFWHGRVLDDGDTSLDTVALRMFNDALVADERVVCVQTTFPDGVTLVRKRGV